MFKRLFGNSDTVKMPDTPRSVVATSQEFSEAATAAEAVYRKAMDGASFDYHEVDVVGTAVRLTRRYPRIEQITQISRGKSGAWWIMRQLTRPGFEIEPPRVRETKYFPFSPEHDVVRETEYSYDTATNLFVPDPGTPKEEVVVGPLPSADCLELAGLLQAFDEHAVMA